MLSCLGNWRDWISSTGVDWCSNHSSGSPFLPLCVFLHPHDQHKGLSEIIWLTNGPIINNIDPLISLTSSTLMTLNGYHYGLFFYSEEKILMNPLLTGRNLKKFKTTFLKLNLLWSEQAWLSVLLCISNIATINILQGASPVTYLATEILIFFSR